ncbi:prsS8 (nucleomorph) [Hemiselmis andersenii]|uniref:PrsS8 n=2 Tax=Hemiselmis andersenii TaxID=464988 RepID=A9BL61_HEMAN|nr:prsS8 [Hemiselmis andersenii]ABW98244.1 prsS8 [Hemiselmis andersenii]|mmetsp:Transcript_20906/g.48308  ORF Transcript_20906/g.48308 Transcript_20906/m.48308 type:complete len:408 (-) Transcript_20906:224-1447(-)
METEIKEKINSEKNCSIILRKYFISKNFLKKKKIEKNILKFQKNLTSIEILNEQLKNFLQEIFLLKKEFSFIGEVVQRINKDKILVKINQDGKFLVNCGKKMERIQTSPGARIAIRSNNYIAHRILSSKTDPLVSLMKIENVPLSTYDSIGGLDFQIIQIKEVIEFPIKFPEIFETLGVTQPKGVLLYGPPGTGKTLLARAVAHHSGCTFIRMSGSELVQKYIGEGSRMVREIFLMAKTHAPSIIFMDEVDSVGSSRGNSEDSNGDSEVQRTMLELLNQLDGFEAQQNIKVMMATNRLDVLDPALIRPGRIDRKIRVPNPNVEGRLAILKIHIKKIKVEPGIDLWKISKNLQGASGADIKAVCTEAGMVAIKNLRTTISNEDFNQGIRKVIYKGISIQSSIHSLFLY